MREIIYSLEIPEGITIALENGPIVVGVKQKTDCNEMTAPASIMIEDSNSFCKVAAKTS
jgi:hypothetical protein